VSDVFASVGVIGLGQIGGSVCKALRARGAAQLSGFDVDPRACALAAADGVTIHTDVAALVRRSELVVLAVPLDKYQALVTPICAGAEGTRGKVLIDVGSGSRPLREAFAHPEARQHLSIIGSHPMAGTERRGYAAAQADLFDGRNWAVLKDGAQPRPADALRVIQWVLSLGARAILLEAERHDEAVARTSHLPHMLAMALARTAYADPLATLRYNFAAGSFRDGTRVADSEPALTAAMCHENAAELAAAMDECLQLLTTARRHLREGGAERLLADFQLARDLKAQLKQAFEHIAEEALREDDLAMFDRLLDACSHGAKIASLTPCSDAAMPRWQARLERPHQLPEEAPTAR
jgi:prephenate dehydrogenase